MKKNENIQTLAKIRERLAYIHRSLTPKNNKTPPKDKKSIFDQSITVNTKLSFIFLIKSDFCETYHQKENKSAEPIKIWAVKKLFHKRLALLGITKENA